MSTTVTALGRDAARPRSSALVVGALVVAAFSVAFGLLHYGFYTRNALLDTPIYERYGDAIVHGHQVPYRDLPVEYPPGALPAFVAPSLAASAHSYSHYRQLFEALMLVCGAAGAALSGFVLVRQGSGATRLVAGTLLAGLAPLALGPVVLSRFDLWPAALTIAALAALVAGRSRLACVVLGGAIAAKLYPAVILPLTLTYVWRRRGRREAYVCSGALAAGAAVFVVPFLILAPAGLWHSVSGQASRPLQIETLGASFLLASHQAFGTGLTQVASHGSDNLAGRLPDALATLQSLLAVATLLGIWIGFARGPAERDRLLRYAAAAVCAFVALGKVLSPQYLIWLFALVPLVRGRRGLAASGLFVAAMVLTQLWFPYRYIDLVYRLDPRSSWLVLARDLVLVAILITLVWPERRALRLGRGVVGTVTVATLAAAATAAASGNAPLGPTHSGLLTETGVASSCAEAKSPPALTGGDVRYEVVRLGYAGAPTRCVFVAVHATGAEQVFSAAYRGHFDPTNPQARYLGDAGLCTNVPYASRRTTRYAFRVRHGASFELEVEACGAGTTVPPYVIDASSRRRPVATFVAARAVQSGNAVVVQWHVTSVRRGARFALERDDGGRAIATIARLRSHGSGAYTATIPHVPLTAAVYAVRAVAPNGDWAWRGPLAVR